MSRRSVFTGSDGSQAFKKWALDVNASKPILVDFFATYVHPTRSLLLYRKLLANDGILQMVSTLPSPHSDIDKFDWPTIRVRPDDNRCG